MVKIEAIIQPGKLVAVREALKAIGVEGVMVTEVRGHGRQKGHTEIYRGREYHVDLRPKIRLEMVMAADRKEEVIGAIIGAARTGAIGDGKIFVYHVDGAVRIRNADRDEAAL